MLHSDRGFQYTSLSFKKLLDANKLTQSMSRVGRCIDNGPMEAFWGTLKWGAVQRIPRLLVYFFI
ncbi:transposase family protein [Paenibacillus apiarius]|nr:transposase family protein [Paenibacillus apiarius]